MRARGSAAALERASCLHSTADPLFDLVHQHDRVLPALFLHVALVGDVRLAQLSLLELVLDEVGDALRCVAA